MTDGEMSGNANAFPDEGSNGLSKREYFAGLAMQGIAANPTTQCSEGQLRDLAKIIAKTAVQLADALLDELSEGRNART